MEERRNGISLAPSLRSTLIRNSEIKFNGGHGISAFYAQADIRGCNISRNGWLWGTPLSAVSPDYDGNAGIYADNSGTRLRVHGCDFSSNVGPGIWVREADIEAQGDITAYDTWDPHGSNCFDGNQKSFFADLRSSVHFGKKAEYADGYKQDLNAFRNPRFRIPTVDGPWVNLHVKEASVADFEHNYWLPDGITWFVQSTEPVSTSHRITNPAEVRCGEGWTGGPTYESPLTENTRNLVRLVTNDSLAAAWQHCKNHLSDQFNGEDAAIYAWALQSIRLAGGLDSAQILLESKAFGGAETALSAYSLLNLRGIYVILGDSASAWKVYDTLSTRLPLEDVVMDTLTVALYKADLLWYINRDSVLAADHISSLYAAYPNDIGVRTMYVEITNDTLAYWYGAVEELEKSSSSHPVHEHPVGLEVLGCHPNPGSSLTTIRYYVPEVSQVELRLYTTDGRLVDVLPLGTRNAGVHHHQYTAGALPSGMYIGVLTDGENRASFKVLLKK
jgi:hypothetical protein